MSFLEDNQTRRLERIATLSPGRQLLHVAFLSGLGLFVELLLIRWLDAQVRPLAYVKNLPLIGCFLGLGLGFGLANRRRSLYPLSALMLCGILLLALAPVGIGQAWAVRGPEGPESNLGVEVAQSAWELFKFYAMIALVFGLVVLATVPLGQIAGTYMRDLPSLRAYSANVAGALGGIVFFALLSAFYVPPYVSALLALISLLAYLGTGRGLLTVSAVVALGTCLTMALADHSGPYRTLWSPYNRIQLSSLGELQDRAGQPISESWLVRVQHLYFQRMLDLRPTTMRRGANISERRKAAAHAYNLPYRFKKPERVLIVGAGTGNDVAAALRHGAREIDAVEIDPLVQRLGRERHPEQPYSDERVRVIIDDARAFLRRPGPTYDMIVFGLLDSHLSTFSSISNNIRLDNYVYTLESIRDALSRLEPDGVLALSFYCEQPWIATRMEAMIEQAQGRTPLVTQTFYDRGVLYLAGPGVPAESSLPRVTVGLGQEFTAKNPAGPISTDAWPFLYLKDRTVPGTVAWASVVVLLVSLGLVWTFVRGGVGFDRHLFFLGAGFLLVETRTIAQLGLLFGTVWRVSALTIGAILTVILLANFWIDRRGPLPRRPLYVLLALGLLANYFVPTGTVLGAGLLSRGAMAAFLVLPLLFASLIFASTIRQRKELPGALASNLTGAVLGGVLENLAMVVGFPALSLIAIAVYAGSYRR